MKRIVVIIITIVLILPVINLFFYTYCNIYYYEDETLLTELNANIEHCRDGKSMDLFKKMYGDNALKLFEEAKTLNFSPVDRHEAIKLLAAEDIDAIARNVHMSMMTEWGEAEARLKKIQFFQLNSTDYFLCYYVTDYSGFKLYSYEPTQEMKEILEEECFGKGKFFSSKRESIVLHAVVRILKCYMPVFILILIMFVPYLLSGKISLRKKTLSVLLRLAKIGCFAVPVCALLCSIYVYRFVPDISVFSDLFR